MKTWNSVLASLILLFAGLLLIAFVGCDEGEKCDDEEEEGDDEKSDDDDDDTSDDDDDDDDNDDVIDSTEMVLVPEFDFLMGCADGDHRCYDNELPSHFVDMPDYYIDLYEVTYEQYAAYLNAANPLNECEGGYCFRTFWPVSLSVLYYQTDGTWTVLSGWEDRPVGGVTWYGAATYCEYVGKRLPTEAEWEKAAKSDTGKFIYPWGVNWSQEAANSFDSSDPYETGFKPESTPVGYYDGSDHDGEYETRDGSSPFGIYDLCGNAAEWVSDRYDAYYYDDEPTGGWDNPQGPTEGNRRVIRGGSWASAPTGITMRNSYRDSYPPEGATDWLGFRCAGYAEGSE